MSKQLISLVVRMYTLLLRLYPAEWRQEYGEELFLVFSEALTAATKQNSLGRFFWRELRETPKAIARVYWYGGTKKWQKGVRRLNEAASSADLPPPPPDGRDSWQQAAVELSPFLTTGLLLILATYLPLAGLASGWQRDMDFLGQIIVPLTLPLFVLGVARGLPRWAYPVGGLLVGYHALSAAQTGLWPFLVVMLTISAILAAAALMTNPQPSPLPVILRRIGQSLSLDWTRLSFGVYGATPLVILIAFDNGYANNRTPYLALSVLVMMAGALFYTRSRQNLTQTAVLVGGISLSIWAAWLDAVTFAGRVGNWTPGPAEMTWIFQLWLTWTFPIFLLAVFTTLGRVARLKGAI
jgi:hypothetical protein